VRTRLFGYIFILALLGAAVSCTTLSPQRLQLSAEERKWQQLEDLIAERLRFMEHLASVKYTSALPIEDTEDEIVRGEAWLQMGAEWGLSPQWVNHFFEAQVEADQITQQAWFDRWNAKETPLPAETKANTLPEVLRKLDRLDARILTALREVYPFLPGSSERLQRMTASLWHGNSERLFPDHAARVALEGLRLPIHNTPSSP